MKKQKIINIIIYILMICVILILSVDRNRLAKEVNNLNERYDSMNVELNNELKAKDATIKELMDKIEELDSAIAVKSEIIDKLPKLDELMLINLKNKGIDDPIILSEDLMKHPELIPYKGSLGGEMAFFSVDDIFVLSDKWVFAYFEDGHNCGYMLLSYEITKTEDNIIIKWKPIDSYIF